MDKLNSEFIKGYTKGLLDVMNFFDEHSNALKVNKCYNQKDVHKILRFLLDNRNELRETGNIDNIIIGRDKNKNIMKGGALNDTGRSNCSDGGS